jgi:ElaB/YqjD/DUF883 family membrane-anchored ribosome-binding protein
MNNQKLENKIRKDVTRTQKDLNMLVKDSAARVNRFEENVNQAAGNTQEGLTNWVEDNVSQVSAGVEKLTGDAMETGAETVATMKKKVGHGLRQYNARAQEVAEKIPGNFAKKATKYSWVAITTAFVVGILVGILITPNRRLIG